VRALEAASLRNVDAPRLKEVVARGPSAYGRAEPSAVA
jgi:hypothetical protein